MGTVTRDEIVGAAGRLFAERGYHGTSMRDLGQEVGLLGSSIYSHVSSKAELLTAVIDKGAQLFQASADAALAADVPALEKLRVLTAGHIDVMMDNEYEVKTFLNESRFLEAEQRQRPLDQRNSYEAAFRQVFEEGVASGAFRPLDSAITSIFTLSILNAVERWYDDAGRLSRAELTDRIVEFCKGSLEEE